MQLFGKIALVLLLVLFRAHSPAFAETWYEFKSDNFVLYSNDKEKKVRKLFEDLEYFRYFLQLLTNVKDTTATIPLEIYAYKNSQYLQRELNLPPGIVGIYVTHNHGTTAYADVSKGYMNFYLNGRQVLFHEYVHHFMRQFSGFQYPTWYDEGFADYLGTFTHEDGIVTVGEILNERVASLRRSTWVPLEKVLDAKGSFLMLYAQGWLFVHYLHADPEKKKQLLVYLQAIHDGVPFEEAFEDSFGVTIREMESELRAYWKAKKLPYTRYNFSNLDFKPQYTVRILDETEEKYVKQRAKIPLTPDTVSLSEIKRKMRGIIKDTPTNLDAKILLAEKMYQLGKDKNKQEAEEMVQEILLADPGNSGANTIMGMIRFWQAFDDEQAETRLEKIQLAREFLKKSITADPTNVFAHYYLGASYVYLDSPLPEPGFAALAKATELYPQNRDFEFEYALLLARYGELEAATFMFERIARWPPYRPLEKKVAAFCLEKFEAAENDHECKFNHPDELKLEDFKTEDD